MFYILPSRLLVQVRNKTVDIAPFSMFDVMFGDCEIVVLISRLVLYVPYVIPVRCF